MLHLKFGANLSYTYKYMTLYPHTYLNVSQFASEKLEFSYARINVCVKLEEYIMCFFMFGVSLKVTIVPSRNV